VGLFRDKTADDLDRITVGLKPRSPQNGIFWYLAGSFVMSLYIVQAPGPQTLQAHPLYYALMFLFLGASIYYVYKTFLYYAMPKRYIEKYVATPEAVRKQWQEVGISGQPGGSYGGPRARLLVFLSEEKERSQSDVFAAGFSPDHLDELQGVGLIQQRSEGRSAWTGLARRPYYSVTAAGVKKRQELRESEDTETRNEAEPRDSVLI
jgi:hypothetical protein